ncbi:hypothetical protein LZP69_05430 [Shewanella sp. AS1]|uniref:hypothetical protein n=1 Tax=Shewanella sp. AS1 TaxID=2907626 RepID=UPI001F26D0DD|nr:hypothetical protein [Shewanella sp. AS1]MCE9678634.1 hypothetical protein [Shewanella sp. AS1]
MLSMSVNKQHLIVYVILTLFWTVFQYFSKNAVEMGWGFILFVFSLPFVPFILVWLGVQFIRHYRYARAGINMGQHLAHCAFTGLLFCLFVYHFVR